LNRFEIKGLMQAGWVMATGGAKNEVEFGRIWSHLLECRLAELVLISES